MSSQASAADAPLVEVENLTVRFTGRDLDVSVVNGVSFTLDRGSSLCILGESGSGKSVTMRALMRLFPPTARLEGKVRVDGIDVLALEDHQLRRIRGGLISMIFQEPMTALDPVFTIGQQIGETLVYHEGISYRAAYARALQLLELVQVPSAKRRLEAYPHELSGGLRQRAMIALALACQPKLLLADEPTTALDATVQIQILLLLREIQREMGMATIFVTHDLGVACEVADKIAVMYAGKFVESGSVEQVIDSPRHPYTQGLMNSTIHADMRGVALDPIPGAPPDLADLPPGCPFAPRCAAAREPCLEQAPELTLLPGGQKARCLQYEAGAAFTQAPLLKAS
ncbi:oligopeptide/dipeptide ABC transporter ATP-binding protein [Azorhizobium caulinodans ORS 571]|uniref:Oligopeptide/dipeptide ABC transporter ATP-binding protein n=1 Tax=Azorhizobium caulinodans (strain ATCC 43989 / DSM 5975 / JCM 20966 / LMG 6465 / NBRC 14845 / NCIMB 13405 / ORS 571) TaxID=438753 RepID=A8IB96_AZOC5|nr:ABC transporter ATP-binding protein [Azorhizobium caulinodans]BAF88628.1 oligopeptide/dipeptide ABC transporter ATP-binding protein [Azorhizobium caulinodans ORS 571]